MPIVVLSHQIRDFSKLSDWVVESLVSQTAPCRISVQFPTQPDLSITIELDPPFAGPVSEKVCMFYGLDEVDERAASCFSMIIGERFCVGTLLGMRSAELWAQRLEAQILTQLTTPVGTPRDRLGSSASN
jgi:hypothetical protein